MYKRQDCYVVAALDQAVMPDGKWIRSGAVRGVASAGMLCSRYELGIDKEKGKGLLILDDAATIGSPSVSYTHLIESEKLPTRCIYFCDTVHV